MKKVILTIAILSLGAFVINAQTPAAVPATSQSAASKAYNKAEKKADASAAKTEKKTEAKLVKEKPAKASGVVLKKDGTPDKRYKNAPANVKGPVKKDGTPDMRFKENKESTPKK